MTSTTVATVAVDIMPEGKTTSTPQMKIMFFLSCAALAFNIVALIGFFSGFTACVDVGFGDPVCVTLSIFGGMGFKGIICLFISLFGLPMNILTAIITLIHWKPAIVLFKSQQLTNEMRARYSKPFQLKYMMVIQAVLFGICGILAGFTMGGTWWAGLMALIAAICYGVNVALVFKHFQNPNVATSLNLEYGSGGGGGGGGGASSAAVKTLEEKVKKLESIVETLQKQIKKLDKKGDLDLVSSAE